MFDKDTASMAFINFNEVLNAYVANIQFSAFINKENFSFYLFDTVHEFSSIFG